MKNIERIVIEKLHGEITYDISLKDNKLILVAENGAGKTTIVNIIYFLLSRQWEKLSVYNMSSVTIFFDKDSISIKKEELNELIKVRRLRSRGIRHLSPRNRVIIDTIITNHGLAKLSNDHFEMERVADRYGISPSILYDVISEAYKADYGPLFDNDFKTKENQLKLLIDAQILYLPTYRRIEQDLKSIFPDLEDNIEVFRKKRIFREERSNIYVELVEFGMEDVEEKIAQVTKELYDNFNNNLLSNITGSYLQDIINRRYSSYEFEQFAQFDFNLLDIVLGRINDYILQDSEKEKLRNFVKELSEKGNLNNEDKVIAHFIFRLIEIYAEQRKKEKDIEDFVEICNSYITNKIFYYDPNSYQLIIALKKSHRSIKLKDLSSGEKQIVSLFSHLYLSKEKKFFLIIDEPELSLSVQWQQKFLIDITKAKYCSGLLAVTHSPFIFENDLDYYTKGLDEFLKLN